MPAPEGRCFAADTGEPCARAVVPHTLLCAEHTPEHTPGHRPDTDPARLALARERAADLARELDRGTRVFLVGLLAMELMDVPAANAPLEHVKRAGLEACWAGATRCWGGR